MLDAELKGLIGFGFCSTSSQGYQILQGVGRDASWVECEADFWFRLG